MDITMSISQNEAIRLEALCKELRIELIKLLHKAQTGHPGGSLSSCEIITLLYQNKMTLDPENPNAKERDRFILSKGHAAPMLYLNLVKRGILKEADLSGFRQINSILQGHPCHHKTPGIDVSTGPLGLGLSVGSGMAAAAKMNNEEHFIYVLLGDGEIQEGSIWEAAMTASKFKLDNMIAILDNNHVQLDGTNEEIMPLGDIAKKFEAFGFRVIRCDGHNIAEFSDAIDLAKAGRGSGAPTIIIAETVKGKGVSYMEGKNVWHGSPISDKLYEIAMSELMEVSK